MKKFLLPLVFVLLASVGFAATDTVMLVSDTTSVDMLIAKAASERAGVPLLVLEDGILADALKTELSDLGVKTVVLVGGPAVISEAIETELAEDYDVVRLWGNERTGTAVEVAKYFWYGGTDCVVLADDTKDSAADTEVQTEASLEASTDGCPFFPVPKGKVPAEVLDTVSQLGATKAKFVGLAASGEFKAKFGKLTQKENVGDLDAIRANIQERIKEKAGEDLRLLVVAAPNWRDVLGHAGHSGMHTVVKVVTSAEPVPRLVEFVNNNNITNVAVVGNPELSAEIVTAFETAGINVTKLSGKHAEVARKALKETKKRWEERARALRAIEVRLRKHMKANLEDYLERLRDRLDQIEAELADMADTADADKLAIVQEKVDAAQTQLTAIESYIENGNYLTARKRLARLTHSVLSARWMNRAALGIDSAEDVMEEENSLENTNSDVSGLASRLDSLKAKCNADALDDIIAEARSLHTSMQTAKEEGDYGKASRLAVQLRNTLRHANNLGNICEKTDKISTNLISAVNQRVQRVQALKTRIGAMVAQTPDAT